MSTQIPNRKTVVSYSYTIQVGGKTVGTLQGFSPTMNRPLERIRELRADMGDQDTFELVPGRTEISATIDRLETYDSNLMTTLGVTGVTGITNATNSFDIVEIVADTLGNERVIFYQDCWVESWSKQVREGTVTVTENATIKVTAIKFL